MIAAKRLQHRQPLLLLDRVRPQLNELFGKYRVPQAEADQMVHQLVLALLYKWESITNHDYWFLKTIDEKCRRLYGG